MIPFTITNKKEQAINLSHKNVRFCDTFYNNKKKLRSKKFPQEIFSLA